MEGISGLSERPRDNRVENRQDGKCADRDRISLFGIGEYQLHTNGVRRLGSAAADIVYTACGRFDAFTHLKLSPWDVAGGALIAMQAGARVTDYSGGDNFLFGREIIVSNPYIYEEFKQRV